MTLSARSASRRLAFLVALVLPFALAACDSTDPIGGGNGGGGGGETFFLPDRNVEFEFEFDGDGLQTGAFTDVPTDETENILTYIQDEGFGSADVVSVRIKDGSGEIELLQPFDGTIGFMTEARVRLIQGSSVGSTIASVSSLPSSGDRATLNIPSEDFATIATDGAFSALLGVKAPASTETYKVKVSFDVVVEVEGVLNRPQL